MSITQFAMVEELASLVKDNIPCQHLILSVEEALVNLLQDDTSFDGVLELEPMNPYNRLLIHRLADIFGFSHQSVGEGEDRHLILERGPETSVPSILVSDLLWQFGEVQSPVTFDVLRRKEGAPGQRDNTASESSLEERETSYFAARERIFAESELLKQRPRSDPVVAQRMITHALGKTNKAINQGLSLTDSKEHGWTAMEQKIQYVDEGPINCGNEMEMKFSSAKHPRSFTTSKLHKGGGSKSSSASKLAQLKDEPTPARGDSAAERKENCIHKDILRKEQVGAAKRLFANALGMQRRDVSSTKCTERKKTDN